MEENIFFLLLAVVLFAVLGPFKFSDLRVRGGNQYRTGNYRFNTPGRNERQRQSAQDRENRRGEARTSRDEAVEAEVSAEQELGDMTEGEAMEHPELARKVQEDERVRRAAAAEARVNKDKKNAELARKLIAQRKQQKGKSALEQASLENRGWRAADQAHEMRSYN